ncbi:MAG: DNA polymerase III subunit beta [bacterium]
MPLENYPLFPEYDLSKAQVVDAGILSKLFNQTKDICIFDKTRPAFSGVFLEGENGKITAVSTDGHRLIVADEQTNLNFPGKIIPYFSANFISNISPGKIGITISKEFMALHDRNWVFFTKFIEGKFPDYKCVIPESDYDCYSLDSLVLKKAIKRSKSKEITINYQAGNCFLSSTQDYGGKIYQEELPCERLSGISPEIKVKINSKYLLDAIAKSSNIKMLNHGAGCAVTMYDNPDYRHIIMPVRE